MQGEPLRAPRSLCSIGPLPRRTEPRDRRECLVATGPHLLQPLQKREGGRKGTSRKIATLQQEIKALDTAVADATAQRKAPRGRRAAGRARAALSLRRRRTAGPKRTGAAEARSCELAGWATGRPHSTWLARLGRCLLSLHAFRSGQAEHSEFVTYQSQSNSAIQLIEKARGR